MDKEPAEKPKELKRLADVSRASLKKLSRYRIVLFFIILLITYGYSIYAINSLLNSTPTTTQVQLTANPLLSAHVDPKVVSQIQALQNNSVIVQTLFEQARNNPFQEGQ